MIQSFSLSQITATDDYMKNAFQKEVDYLTSFDCDRLLSFFRQTKNLSSKAIPYQGWENTEIRGHTLGHYLSALAQAYATNQDFSLYERLQYIIEELAFCQFENGYLSAFPEEFFDRVERGEPVWVPWYTMHKIIDGLNTVYLLVGLSTARNILQNLGDWVFNRTDKWTPVLQSKVLQVEYGGMNDCMYTLYSITQNEKHQLAAHKFDELSLFEPIFAGNDILENRHANTTIPKFLGALNRYLILGKAEEFYLTACKNFWDKVVNAHSYVTGGNSEWEHFGKPYILNARRTQANCETCNTYNMLKLSKGLFQITSERKYADFYERTLINAIFSSQNPSTGMTTYFQPMATGYFKVYSRPFDHFWCCTGTGMENFTKLQDSIYFHEKNTLFINLYLSSTLNWEEYRMILTQNTDIPNTGVSSFQITAEKEITATLFFRIPPWASAVTLLINGELLPYALHDGYALVNRTWRNQDQILIEFEMEVQISSLADDPNVVSFLYGPLVLSAALGTDSMEESTTGVSVCIPKMETWIKDYLVIAEENVEEWKSKIKKHLIKKENTLEFYLRGTDEDNTLCFTPHYKQHKERYGIYWKLVEAGGEELNTYLELKNKKMK